ncbi:MAG: hypothetical protein II194_02765 [Bacteroidales bacterium]|nr:hypothetical protein [Bacteroidales bacterium]
MKVKNIRQKVTGSLKKRLKTKGILRSIATIPGLLQILPVRGGVMTLRNVSML